MRKFFFLLAALMVATSVMSENPMSFTVNGPEERYNQIKVVNHTSYSNFECRVFALNEDDSVGELYGIYNLKGYDDTDSKVRWVDRNTKLGIQFPDELPGEVEFLVEYKDYPLYDLIVIYFVDKK
jgi:hypothetical protein